MLPNIITKHHIPVLSIYEHYLAPDEKQLLHYFFETTSLQEVKGGVNLKEDTVLIFTILIMILDPNYE